MEMKLSGGGSLMKKFSLSVCVVLLLGAWAAATGANEMVFLNILDMHSTGPNKVDMVVSFFDEDCAPIKCLCRCYL
jgi:hypothetical protein